LTETSNKYFYNYFAASWQAMQILQSYLYANKARQKDSLFWLI